MKPEMLCIPEKARTNRQAYLAKLLEQNPPAINELNLPAVLAQTR